MRWPLLALLCLWPGPMPMPGPAPAAWTPSVRPLLSEYPETASHVWFDGNRMRERKAVSWSMEGNVPQVATGPDYTGVSTSGRLRGAGPFTASDYYHASTTGLMDIGNSVALTIEVIVNSDGTAATILGNRGAGGNAPGVEMIVVANDATTWAPYCWFGDGSSAPLVAVIPVHSGRPLYIACTVEWIEGQAVFTLFQGAELYNSTSPTAITGSLTSAQDVRIGWDNFGGYQQLSGYVYEVQVLRGRALTVAEMTARWNALRAKNVIAAP